MRWVLALLLVMAWGSPGRSAERKPMSEIAAGNNQFAVDLHAQLRAQPGNLFFSPYSLSTALGMTYAGARGETAIEMARTLHFPSGAKAPHDGFRELQRAINAGGNSRPYRLAVANALWAQ